MAIVARHSSRAGTAASKPGTTKGGSRSMLSMAQSDAPSIGDWGEEEPWWEAAGT